MEKDLDEVYKAFIKKNAGSLLKCGKLHEYLVVMNGPMSFEEISLEMKDSSDHNSKSGGDESDLISGLEASIKSGRVTVSEIGGIYNAAGFFRNICDSHVRHQTMP